ncbi:hypothetical protein [Pleomorphovibrio marinus]|uniref:hypothetical protein n=1 Tax=Pleomorphovibrio marinus TaxID=2164132 RepID=UPI0013004711|nr:hypothetical protein [Pleomorphovibrio marinus]
MTHRLGLHFLIAIFVLLSFGLYGQEERTTRLNLGLGGAVSISPFSSSEGNIGAHSGSSPSISLHYFKSLHAHFDIKASVGWQGIASNALQSSSYRSGNMRYLELLPLYYTNPNKLGYVPSRFQFYMGAGIGFAHKVLTKDQQVSLNENELALLEFGLLDLETQSREELSSFYLPITFGVLQKTKGTWQVGYEASFGIRFSPTIEQGSILVPAWAQFRVLIGKNVF